MHSGLWLFAQSIVVTISNGLRFGVRLPARGSTTDRMCPPSDATNRRDPLHQRSKQAAVILWFELFPSGPSSLAKLNILRGQLVDRYGKLLLPPGLQMPWGVRPGIPRRRENPDFTLLPAEHTRNIRNHQQEQSFLFENRQGLQLGGDRQRIDQACGSRLSWLGTPPSPSLAGAGALTGPSACRLSRPGCGPHAPPRWRRCMCGDQPSAHREGGSGGEPPARALRRSAGFQGIEGGEPPPRQPPIDCMTLGTLA